MSVDDVMEPEDNAPGRDRREHGGAVFDRPDDDALAERTAQERVDAGVQDYDPTPCPPPTRNWRRAAGLTARSADQRSVGVEVAQQADLRPVVDGFPVDVEHEF